MSHSEERLASYLREELAKFIQRHFAHDEGIFVSLSRVDPAVSLETALAFIFVFPDEAAEKTIKELKKYEKEARKYIMSRLKRRKIPKIIFKLEKDVEREARLEKTFEKIKNE